MYHLLIVDEKRQGQEVDCRYCG